MEMVCIGFLLGAVVCLIFTGFGVCLSDSIKGSRGPDPEGIQAKEIKKLTYEDKKMVLDTFRVGASTFEQMVIDDIEEDIKNERNQMEQ